MRYSDFNVWHLLQKQLRRGFFILFCLKHFFRANGGRGGEMGKGRGGRVEEEEYKNISKVRVEGDSES